MAGTEKKRSLAYRTWGHLFYYPQGDRGIFRALTSDFAYVTDLITDELLNSESDKLREAIKSSDIEDLQVEYVRLFDYRPLCPPYESAYCKDVKRNDIMRDLHDLYTQGGLKLGEGIVADHISVQMEFMHYLCARMDSESGNKLWKHLQKSFLEDHLLKWVPLFSESLRTHGKGPFQYLGTILSAFMERERLQISI